MNKGFKIFAVMALLICAMFITPLEVEAKTVKYDDSLDITASVAHFIYQGAEGNFKEKYGVTENQKYKKEITAVGLSITKKF